MEEITIKDDFIKLGQDVIELEGHQVKVNHI